jgi:hypothetical protein
VVTLTLVIGPTDKESAICLIPICSYIFGPQAGANAFLLRDFVGHSTIAMTSEYVARVVDPVRAIATAVSNRGGHAFMTVRHWHKSVERITDANVRSLG